MDLGSIAGTPVGVMGNSEQGYGRAVLTQVLPLSNWSDDFVLNPNSVREHPAAGLLAWDHLATGEPVINNTTVVSMTHTFRIGGPNFMNPAPTGPTRVVRAAELRIGLAWPDVPSAAGSGGPLVNDLDLVLESPGPDGCLFAGDIRWDGATCGPLSPADNLFYDGNVYDGGHAKAIT